MQRTAKKPRGKPFEKGDSRINRQGKSKELADLEGQFRQALADELLRLDSTDETATRKNFQAIAAKWVELAKFGNLAAIQGLVERFLGKPVQPVSGEGEIRVIVEHIGGSQNSLPTETE